MELFIVCALMFTLSCYTATGQEYHVTEESSRERFLGNIADANKISQTLDHATFSSLKYKFLSQDNPVAQSFRIEENTGDIFVSRLIDREETCGPVAQCVLDFDIAAYAKGFFESYNVRVIIDDINDNAPAFMTNEITLNIPESAPVDSGFPLVGAKDADERGHNSDIVYSLTEAGASNGKFGLEIGKTLTGNGIQIVVRSPLDRERTEAYRLLLIAKDKGIPRRTTSLVINVIVQDVNDHAPEFQQSVYNVSVDEDFPVGSLIQQVSAIDRDIGSNAQIVYRFSPRMSQSPHNLFRIDNQTGEVFTSGNLDYEHARVHRLIVEARDLGLVRSLSADTLLVINVRDVNDNEPRIIFDFLTGEDTHAQIPEDAKLGEFLAHLSVFDPDSGANGHVTCRLNVTAEFRIEHKAKNKYKIVVNAALDRETTDQYDVVVICSDRGIPAGKVTKNLPIAILDENDHAPSFSQDTYYAIIMENNQDDDVIAQCTATDEDIGKNSDLTYFVPEDIQQYLSVDSKTGLIKANGVLDREKTPQIRFVIHVRDGGDPTLTASASVIVTLLDQNDNVPAFLRKIEHFYMPENSPANSNVGTVNAHDPDLGIAGKIEYYIKLEGDDSTNFTMSAGSGEIRSNTVFDREMKSEYRFTVFARDHEDPSRTSSVLVIVHILDENDNTPIIIFPNGSDHVIEIPVTLSAMSLVTSVSASDPDAAENATLVYSLQDTTENCSRCFIINTSNGEIFLADDVQLEAGAMYNLVVIVRDNGTFQRETRELLSVLVISDGQYRQSYDDIANMNSQLSDKLVIIIAVVAATILVSASIIFIIIFLRAKDRKTDLNKFPVLDVSSTDSSANCVVDLDTSLDSAKVQSPDISRQYYQKAIVERVDIILPKRKTVSFAESDESVANDVLNNIDKGTRRHVDTEDITLWQECVTRNAQNPPEAIAYTTPATRQICSTDQHRTYYRQFERKGSLTYQSAQHRLPPLASDDTYSNSSIDSDVTDSGKGGSVDGVPININGLTFSPHYV